jgi:hypothetical protein
MARDGGWTVFAPKPKGVKTAAQGFDPELFTQLGGKPRIVGKRRAVQKNTGWKPMLRTPDPLGVNMERRGSEMRRFYSV